MTSQSIVSVFVAVTAFSMSPATQASLDWHWSFDQPNYIVGPSATILVRATFYNEPTSTENFRFLGIGGQFTGDFQKIFDYTPGAPGVPFGMDLLRANVAPGESFSFAFGVLSPVGGIAPAGTHLADPAFISLNGSELREARNRFQVTVVPDEGSSLAWVLGGGLALGWAQARRRENRA